MRKADPFRPDWEKEANKWHLIARIIKNPDSFKHSKIQVFDFKGQPLVFKLEDLLKEIDLL